MFTPEHEGHSQVAPALIAVNVALDNRAADLTLLESLGKDAEALVQPIEPIAASEGAPGVGLRMKREDGFTQICAKLDPEAAYLEENVRPRYTFESGRSKYGDLETDARYVVLDISSGKVAYSLVEATKLLYAGRELFAPGPVPMRQDDGTYTRMGTIRWRAWEDEVAL